MHQINKSLRNVTVSEQDLHVCDMTFPFLEKKNNVCLLAFATVDFMHCPNEAIRVARFWLLDVCRSNPSKLL